mmetsp:Transcript_37298/g.81232  ORF Transcript_37298/g.81232 Transcript_37298/m.81232 type:complete len:232 (+) Transcript_37298:281-976(+)
MADTTLDCTTACRISLNTLRKSRLARGGWLASAGLGTEGSCPKSCRGSRAALLTIPASARCCSMGELVNPDSDSRNVLSSALCRSTGCATSMFRYFSSCTRRSSTNSLSAESCPSMRVFSGRCGMKYPRWLSASTSASDTKSRNRRRTENFPAAKPGSEVVVVTRYSMYFFPTIARWDSQSSRLTGSVTVTSRTPFGFVVLELGALELPKAMSSVPACSISISLLSNTESA